MFLVYRHTSHDTGKHYVGWTSKSMTDRWKKHLQSVFGGSTYYFHNAIRKYGQTRWDHTILEQCELEKDAKFCEQKWIAIHRSNDPYFGYNRTTGGESSIPNDSARQKMSIAQQKRWQSDEQRAIVSRTFKGKCLSDDHKQKLSLQKQGSQNPSFGKIGSSSARFGKTHSEETKQKIREKKLGHKLSDEAKELCRQASLKRWGKL